MASTPQAQLHAPAPPHSKLAFNADAAAIVIALAFAVLIRLNLIHGIGW